MYKPDRCDLSGKLGAIGAKVPMLAAMVAFDAICFGLLRGHSPIWIALGAFVAFALSFLTFLAFALHATGSANANMRARPCESALPCRHHPARYMQIEQVFAHECDKCVMADLVAGRPRILVPRAFPRWILLSVRIKMCFGAQRLGTSEHSCNWGGHTLIDEKCAAKLGTFVLPMLPDSKSHA